MILRIALLLVILLVLPALYIDRKLIHGRLQRWLLWTPNVLLALVTLWFVLFEGFGDAEVFWKGLYLIVLLAVTVPEAVFALISLAGRASRRPVVRRAANGFGLVVALLLCGAMLYGYAFGAYALKVREASYASPDLPAAFDGYRIVQVSDLHVGTFASHPEAVRRVVEAVNAQHPDLIVFTGDLVNYHAEELIPFGSELARLRARDGVVSILGNHDYMSYHDWPSEAARQANLAQLVRRQRNMGWQLLLNDNVVVRRGADSIAIVGVENDGLPPFPQRGDLTQAQRGVEQAGFKVLLSHDPTHWRRCVLSTTDIDLTLSGHTHGMQLKIGGFSPASWFYDEWGGFYYDGGRALHVSLGAGEVLMPFRLGAWPEVNVITLRKK